MNIATHFQIMAQTTGWHSALAQVRLARIVLLDLKGHGNDSENVDASRLLTSLRHAEDVVLCVKEDQEWSDSYLAHIRNFFGNLVGIEEIVESEESEESLTPEQIKCRLEAVEKTHGIWKNISTPDVQGFEELCQEIEKMMKKLATKGNDSFRGDYKKQLPYVLGWFDEAYSAEKRKHYEKHGN